VVIVNSTAIFVLITHIDDDKDLYCSHEVLTEATKEPTVFCTLSGRFITDINVLTII